MVHCLSGQGSIEHSSKEEHCLCREHNTDNSKNENCIFYKESFCMFIDILKRILAFWQECSSV